MKREISVAAILSRMTPAWSRTLSLPAALVLAASAAMNQQAAGATPLPEPGPVLTAWQTQSLSFVFQSKQSVYSCDAVGDKVWRTLYRLGARQDMHISARGCEMTDPFRNSFRSSQAIVLKIEIASPYEPDPIDREGVTGERGRQELLQKAAGAATSAPDITEQFPARWSRVKVSEFEHLEPGDCELVLQIEKQLFPKLGIRVVENQMSCLPGRQFRGYGLFEVEALLHIRQSSASE